MAAPYKTNVDWSDSSDEEDERSDVETNVLLGVPDGEIEKQEDITDAAVSRIGGHPAFLTSAEPSISSSQCKSCSFPMELLVQLWCPFEDSPMDRALYVFGCARGECQHKPGTVRAFRGLRYNTTYAAKLEKKREREYEKEVARLKAKEEEGRKKAAAKVNPFSMSTTTPPSGGLFGAPPTFRSGIGTHLFGPSTSDPITTKKVVITAVDDKRPPSPPESDSEPDDSVGDHSDSDESGSNKSILAAPAHTPSTSSPWLSIPSYIPPLYLSTATEYVPPAPKLPKLPTSVSSLQDGEDVEFCGEGGKSKKAEARRAEKEKTDAREAKAWENAMEGYEDSLEVDKVFEKFARVAGYEGEQCIRYELGGTPLPYSNDSIFKSLFRPSSSSASTLTTTSVSSSTKHKPASLPHTATQGHRTYNPKAQIIPHCPRCKKPRTFECQLMPNLISVLQKKRDSSRSQSQSRNPEERKKELEQLLGSGSSKGKDGTGGGEGGEEKRGMEWGTCLIFSCSEDCSLDTTSETPSSKDAGVKGINGMKEVKELWAEELVLIQWDE